MKEKEQGSHELMGVTSREFNARNQFTNYTVSDLNIDEIVPNVVDDVVIGIVDGHHSVFLPTYMQSINFSNFMKGRGGVFSRDVNNFCNGRAHGSYALVVHDRGRAIVRFIEDDEWLQFEVGKMIDGKVKDRYYSIIRELGDDDGLTSSVVKVKYREEEPDDCEPEKSEAGDKFSALFKDDE